VNDAANAVHDSNSICLIVVSSAGHQGFASTPTTKNDVYLTGAGRMDEIGGFDGFAEKRYHNLN